jgi:hypothetical protein
MKHRGGTSTDQNYRGIPIHAADSVHEFVTGLLQERLRPGARIADLGAGHGALSLRLRDAGFEVVAFELDRSDWLVSDIRCHQCDFNVSLKPIEAHGPFAAICAIEVIDHLENPINFLRSLADPRRFNGPLLVMSMPNPLDTFSCIAMFTRGIFSWAGPAQYDGGGHISVLPHWLVAEHLKHIGVANQEWQFLAPYRHPVAWKSVLYKGVAGMRRLLSRGEGCQPFFDGQTALVTIDLAQVTSDEHSQKIS